MFACLQPRSCARWTKRSGDAQPALVKGSRSSSLSRRAPARAGQPRVELRRAQNRREIELGQRLPDDTQHAYLSNVGVRPKVCQSDDTASAPNVTPQDRNLHNSLGAIGGSGLWRPAGSRHAETSRPAMIESAPLVLSYELPD